MFQEKIKKPAEASQLYIGSLFKKTLEFCKQNYKTIFILSAKYGLLKPEQIIKPYELDLRVLPRKEKQIWVVKIKTQIKELNINIDDVDVYINRDYYKILPFDRSIYLYFQGCKQFMSWVNLQKSKMKKFF